jgi:2-(3-amino-3-carboxypropyl)histidine synthase
MFELDIDRVVKEIKRREAGRVLLQLPDGMRSFAFDIAEQIRAGTPTEVIISGDSCYGACDIASRQARELGVDLLIHYGHSCFVADAGVPVLYVEARISINVTKMVEAVLPSVADWASVGLTSVVQHSQQLGEVKEALASRGIKALLGEGEGQTPEPGQVLGCSYSAATRLSEDVDGYIFIGGGRFHPLGLALKTGKPIIIANPYNGTVTRLDPSELMQLAKRRLALITAARNAKKIGILVSSKPGQLQLSDAMVLAEKLGDREVTAFLIYLDEVRAEQLNNFTEPEAFIETACPRIAIDGVAGVERPILTTQEARVLLGERTWEQTWGPAYLG